MNCSPQLKQVIRAQFRAALQNSIARSAMNKIIDTSPPLLKRKVHGSFGLIFQNYNGDWEDCDWFVTFLGKKIQMPLQKNTLNMDWITAVTLMGHDIEEKATYANILRSSYRPDVFVDVGGNLGTHSLMMLSQGIETKYIEPNLICHEPFRRLCRRNNLSCELLQCALSDANGFEKLSFPADKTWLGSTQRSIVEKLSDTYDMVEALVPVMTLDDVTNALRGKRILIKVDAEGAESHILRGAQQTFSALRPVFMIEVLAGDQNREDIFSIFAGHDYELFAQPWHWQRSAPLHKGAFIGRAGDNFVAVPRQSLA